jgi:hypothetical protein
MTPAGPYQVLYSGAVRDRVQRLFTRAVAAGVGQRVASALQFVEGHLTLDPTVGGELIFRLRHAGLHVYHRMHDGLYVVFAVHEGDRRVWLTRVYPIFGHPLHDPGERPS